MQLSLTADVQKLIDEQVRSGRFASAEEVVTAAVLNLGQRARFGDFEQGELDELLADGEASIAAEGTLDGDEAFAARNRRRAEKRGR